ncbi:class I SAM-dependent methyltransferase [Allorhizobium undicola]|uniref:class I SAM-dependent methyltransferase n=1 Tax=Allorhizobium undicola TaxID=78527 RepID=UPI0004883F63|nr:methyltransferase [Allorhizobium undicola]
MRIDPEQFIRQNTSLAAPPHVPEIKLHLASEVHDLWQKTEEDLAEIGLPPPFWAFAWAGGQGLARYVLDNPHCVRGRRVVDFATGSGLVAIAAARAGAKSVTALDIDPFTGAAVRLNAAANGVAIDFHADDRIGQPLDADVLLAGDVFYDRDFCDRLMPWFAAVSASGVMVLVGDPGRSYFPRQGFQPLATYEVPVTRALEDSEVKKTTVWRFVAGS